MTVEWIGKGRDNMVKALPENLRITALWEAPDRKETAAKWFAGKWDVPESAYLESICECIQNPRGIPRLNESGEILAGLGIIANDFHKRKDLTPNVCALYVEPEHRGGGIARALLDFAREDACAGHSQAIPAHRPYGVL